MTKIWDNCINYCMSACQCIIFDHEICPCLVQKHSQRTRVKNQIRKFEGSLYTYSMFMLHITYSGLLYCYVHANLGDGIS